MLLRANEIGVVFNSPKPQTKESIENELMADPELVAVEGLIEGVTFYFRAAHFEWLLRIANKLDLDFTEIGHRKHGTAATLLFCRELIRLYGSSHYLTSAAASFAVEYRAAA